MLLIDHHLITADSAEPSISHRARKLWKEGKEQWKKRPGETDRPAWNHAFHPVDLKLPLDHLHHLHTGQHSVSSQVIHNMVSCGVKKYMGVCACAYECRCR